MNSEFNKICRNCGSSVRAHYCSECGQEVEERRGPLPSLIREILADWFSVDSRLWRTLRAIVVPGRLTALHVDGKRAPYLRPFRLYLLSSLLLFSTLLTFKAPDASEVNIYVGGELIHEQEASEVNKQIQLVSDDSWFGRWLIARFPERLEHFRSLPPQDLLDSVFTVMRQVLPASLVLFVPFLAGALKLLYWRTQHLYVDHLIFSLHFQSALFLALSASWLITRILGLPLQIGFLIYALTGLSVLTFYLAMASRRFYGQRWHWVIAKTLVLVFVYLRLLGVALGPAILLALWRA